MEKVDPMGTGVRFSQRHHDQYTEPRELQLLAAEPNLPPATVESIADVRGIFVYD